MKFLSNGEKNVIFFVAFSFSFYIILLGVNAFVNLFAYETVYDSVILYSVLFISIIFSIVPIIKMVNSKQLVVILVMAIVSLISIVRNVTLVEFHVKFILTVMPYIFIGFVLDIKREYFKKYISLFTKIACIAGASQILFSIIKNGGYTHDMTSAYSLLPSAIFSIYFLFTRRRVIDILVFLAMTVELLFFGVRWPIALYGFSFVILMLYFSKNVKFKVLLTIFSLSTVLIFISGLYSDILTNISNFFIEIGITNSVIERILNGTLTEQNGRDVIYNTMMELVKDKPIIGYGLFFDRTVFGAYAHNIIIELWINFGFLLGSLFIIATMFNTIKIINTNMKNDFVFVFIIMVIIMSLGQLLISGSYLENTYFFLLIGLFFNHRFNHSNGVIFK